MAEQDQTHDPLFDGEPTQPAPEAAPAAPAAPAAKAPRKPKDLDQAQAPVAPAETAAQRARRLKAEYEEARAAAAAEPQVPEPPKPTLVQTRAQLRASLARVAERRKRVREGLRDLGVRTSKRPVPQLFKVAPTKKRGE